MLAGSGKSDNKPAPVVAPKVDALTSTEMTDAEYRMNTGRKRAKLESSLLPNQTNTLGG